MKKLVPASIALLVLTFILFTFQTSCKKETTTVNNCKPTIVGLWTGSWQSSVSGGGIFNVIIKPDGTASYENIVSNTQQLAIGTWTLTGSTLTINTTCVYGYPGNVGTVQTFTATYNSTTGALTNGTFQNISPNHDSGTITLTEAN